MIAPVANERLTRHDISWLLAQEARGAAKALREGVTRLTNPPPSGDAPASAIPSVQTTLDALDGAIGMLSALSAQPVAKPASRRGRIDLAALLYEVAPQARIKMAPGEGTEVLGDEGELRRILHMLVNQTHATPSGMGSTASPEVDIRRDGEFVKISVDLGPDSSATAELERRWLNRMAMQHGGRLEFKGGRQSLFLPADGATDQREVVELRKELQQAQQLGEAYARELASVFASGLPNESSPAPDAVATGPERFEMLVGLATGLEGTLKDWLEASRDDTALAQRELGDRSALVQRLSRRHVLIHDLQRELAAISSCPVDEPRAEVDLGSVLREAIDAFAPRCARSEIDVALSPAGAVSLHTHPRATQLLARALLEHAISATPNGHSVRIELTENAEAITLNVTDAGPNVPANTRRDVMRLAMDPTHLGRPGGISLLVAHAAAGRLGGTLSLSETPDGKTLVTARLPRT